MARRAPPSRRSHLAQPLAPPTRTRTLLILGGGLLLLGLGIAAGAAVAITATGTWPDFFVLTRAAYSSVEDWAQNRGRQIRVAFGLGLDDLRPVGTIKPQTLSADTWNARKIATLAGPVRERFRTFVADVQAVARRNGREVIIWDAARPLERQLDTLRSGASRTIASRHLLGMAVDLVLRHQVTGAYDGPCSDCATKRWPDWYRNEIVPLGKFTHGLFWGGDFSGFSDTPHWEIPEAEWPPVVVVALAQLREDFPGLA